MNHVATALIALTLSLVLLPSARAAVLAYEGFDYPNDAPANTLVSQTGSGTGWDGDWHETLASNNAALYLVSQNDVSLVSAASPFTPTGDHATIGAGTAAQVLRKFAFEFDMAAAGTLYGSLLFRKDTSATSTSADNFEVDLVGGLTATAGTTIGVTRAGFGSNENAFIGAGNGTSLLAGPANALPLETVFFMTFKVTASPDLGADTISLKAFAPGDVIPETEPVWDLTANLPTPSTAENSVINGIRIMKGANASGAFDEIRIGETWADVTASTSTPQAGDFDGDGDVDGADFVAWQTNFPKATGATLAEGDADGDGDVDGADFVVWQTNFPFTPGPGSAPVPEPAGCLPLLVGLMAIGMLSMRRRPQPVAVR